MRKLVFFSMLFLASIVSHAQTTYGGLTGNEAGQSGSPTCSFFGTNAGNSNTTGFRNTFIGQFAGQGNEGGRENTFVGATAGGDNVNARWNVFVGAAAGRLNAGNVAHYNTYIGYRAGFSNLEGANNVFLGNETGFNATGSNNVFIGNRAGFNEMGSNRLHIHNDISNEPLIGGNFNARTLTFNGEVSVNGDIPPTSILPADGIQLFVDGRFSQLMDGTLGGFTPNDRWSSLGNTPTGVSPIYGMINQAYEATFVSGSKANGNNIIGWSGNRLDFDVIGMSGQPTTGTKMFITSDGKVAIGGDVVPTPGNYKLYVKDGILTEKIMVQACPDWADYVFDEDYARNTTEEVEQFVKENKHLPNVPSAKEVSENGIDMAEMDATLLRQIEELWLHVIDLKKENEALKTEVEDLKK